MRRHNFRLTILERLHLTRQTLADIGIELTPDFRFDLLAALRARQGLQKHSHDQVIYDKSRADTPSRIGRVASKSIPPSDGQLLEAHHKQRQEATRNEPEWKFLAKVGSNPLGNQRFKRRRNCIGQKINSFSAQDFQVAARKVGSHLLNQSTHLFRMEIFHIVDDGPPSQIEDHSDPLHELLVANVGYPKSHDESNPKILYNFVEQGPKTVLPGLVQTDLGGV